MPNQWTSAQLAALADLDPQGARENHFAARPEESSAALAWRLAEESGRTLRVDLDRAERMAALAVWVAERVEDHRAAARGLRAQANVLYFRRRYREAAEVYGRAIRGFDRYGPPIEAAVTRSSAIGSLSHLARYDEALATAAAARRVFEAEGDDLRLARLEVGVGHVLSRQDRFAEAIVRFRAALEFFADNGDSVDAASTLRNIAVCYQDLNDFRAAAAAYEEARDYCREHGQTLIGLEIEVNIAYLFYLRGEYSRAIQLLERARRSCEEHDDRHHAALCDLDLAEIYLELNLAADADHLASRAHDAFEALGMAYERGKALAYLAVAGAAKAAPETTLEQLRGALELFEGQGNRTWSAVVRQLEAQVLLHARRLDSAAATAARAAGDFADCGVPTRVSVCRNLQARIELARGDLDAARRHSSVARAEAERTDRPLLKFESCLVAGRIEEAAGDLSTARERFECAHRELESLRGQLRTDELKISFADDKQAVYEGLFALTLARGRDADTLAEAFSWVETAKSRSLADLLSVGAPGSFSERVSDPQLAAEVKELRAELAWFYRQIAAEELAGGERARRRLEDLRRESTRREEALVRHLRRIAASDPDFSSLHGAAVGDLAAVRQALPADTCLIEYFVARGELFAFDVCGSSIAVRELGPIGTVRRLHQKLQFQLGKFRLGSEYVDAFAEVLQRHTIDLLQQLHGLLLVGWSPPPGARRLVVVPHDLLHQLPFHALHDGDGYLLDRLAVSYAPSATVFALSSRRRVRHDGRSLVLAVPDRRAPKILDEAQAVAALLPQSRLLVGAEASSDRLAELAPGRRFVHISTHGLYRKDNPIFSAIQLGDTRLALLDLYGIRLDAELAVLSGCGTGLSEVQGADELVGLTRGLLFAGARSVVAPLWDVNDDSTAELMRVFYRRLTAGQSPSAALREAMLALRAERPHPYFWAPFVVTGPA